MIDTAQPKASTFIADLRSLTDILPMFFMNNKLTEEEATDLEECRRLLTKVIMNKEMRQISEETGRPFSEIQEKLLEVLTTSGNTDLSIIVTNVEK